MRPKRILWLLPLLRRKCCCLPATQSSLCSFDLRKHVSSFVSISDADNRCSPVLLLLFLIKRWCYPCPPAVSFYATEINGIFFLFFWLFKMGNCYFYYFPNDPQTYYLQDCKYRNEIVCLMQNILKVRHDKISLNIPYRKHFFFNSNPKLYRVQFYRWIQFFCDS